MTKSICVVMPAYNEGEGISSFLDELHEDLAMYDSTFVVINDRSTDSTESILLELAKQGFPVSVLTNYVNSGHGPSTVRALRAGLESGASVIVAIDGDGQFLGKDVRKLVDLLVSGSADLCEGVRTSRSDPGYRKVTSAATRILVWLRVLRWAKDANTPLRVYKRSTLESLVEEIPPAAMTPNLFISILARKRRLVILEVIVQSIPRRGSEPIGSTWGHVSRIPGRRFILFCTRATREWFCTRLS